MLSHKQKYIIALSHFPKFGQARIKKLLNYFSSSRIAYEASHNELLKAGIDTNLAQEFISARSTIEPDKIIAQLEKENIKVATQESDEYPDLLKEIFDPPALLYYRGQLKGNDEFAISVVGTRKFSSYGRQITEKIVAELSQNKITIISGLALGIDTIAHHTCLGAGGRTIAVLGTGIDRASLYPSANRFLVDKITASGGAVISEFPIGTAPLKHNFPQRNRIISGLSLGTLVAEAGERSGALITARSALDQNREVFAIPGSILSPTSHGPNYLLKQGAKVVTGAEDILETLDLKRVAQYIENKNIIPESKEEEALLEHLSHEPRHIDELMRLTSLAASAINATLAMMEMKGQVRNLGNMQYVLAR